MAGKGPPPTPTKILKYRGSERAKGRKNEPEPEVGVPRCPGHLFGEALEHWDRTIPLLADVGVLTINDGEALATYCDALVRLDVARRDMDVHGMTDGDRVRPAFRVYTELVKQTLAFQMQFGLTPAARPRLKVDKRPEKKSKDRFFKTG